MDPKRKPLPKRRRVFSDAYIRKHGLSRLLRGFYRKRDA
jgi:hypothetical protein